MSSICGSASVSTCTLVHVRDFTDVELSILLILELSRVSVKVNWVDSPSISSFSSLSESGVVLVAASMHCIPVLAIVFACLSAALGFVTFWGGGRRFRSVGFLERRFLVGEGGEVLSSRGLCLPV